MNVFLSLLTILAIFSCKSGTHNSSTKFWDLPNMIEEARSNGILDDIFEREGDCKEALENDDDSDSCTTQQIKKESLIKACDAISEKDSSEIIEPSDLESSVNQGNDTSFNACYEAQLGLSRVVLGEMRAELDLKDDESEKNISSSMTGEVELFNKPVDIFDASFFADSLNPKTNSNITVFGKEVFVFDKTIPNMEFAYTGDSPKEYSISYGLPIPKFLVNPELRTGMLVTGDIYLGLKPFSKQLAEINFKSRSTGAAYARPYSNATLQIFGLDIFSAKVGGFLKAFSDDVIKHADLSASDFSKLEMEKHKSNFMQGSLYTEANLLKTKYYHFFFADGSQANAEKVSCEDQPVRTFCPCNSVVQKINSATDKDSIYLRDEEGAIIEPNNGLVCDPTTSTWMAVSKPMWTKKWNSFLWESRKK